MSPHTLPQVPAWPSGVVDDHQLVAPAQLPMSGHGRCALTHHCGPRSKITAEAKVPKDTRRRTRSSAMCGQPGDGVRPDHGAPDRPFCVPRPADTGCLEADHNGGYSRDHHGAADHALLSASGWDPRAHHSQRVPPDAAHGPRTRVADSGSARLGIPQDSWPDVPQCGM
jgi:hypothetical protein